jgi:hypothetical protein
LALAEPLVRSITDKGVNKKKHISLTGIYIQGDKDDFHIPAHRTPTLLDTDSIRGLIDNPPSNLVVFIQHHY